MNRREFLGGLIALPVAGAAALVAAQNDGVALMSVPHPVGPFDASELDLTEESIETVCDIDVLSRRYTEALNRSMMTVYEEAVYVPITYGRPTFVRSA